MTADHLQNEIKKKHPFKTLEEEALLNLLRTNDLFGNRFGRLFREYKLTGSQYNVLRILRGEGRAMPSLEIAERLIHVVPAITGLIDRLEKQALVVRRRCEEDRRVVYVDITKKALKILKKTDEPLADLQQRLLGHMSRTELKTLSRLLEKARESLSGDDGDP